MSTVLAFWARIQEPRSVSTDDGLLRFNAPSAANVSPAHRFAVSV